jgi:hypothetical protein
VIRSLSCTGIIHSDLIYPDYSRCILHTFTHNSIIICINEPVECQSLNYYVLKSIFFFLFIFVVFLRLISIVEIGPLLFKLFQVLDNFNIQDILDMWACQFFYLEIKSV